MELRSELHNVKKSRNHLPRQMISDASGVFARLVSTRALTTIFIVATLASAECAGEEAFPPLFMESRPNYVKILSREQLELVSPDLAVMLIVRSRNEFNEWLSICRQRELRIIRIQSVRGGYSAADIATFLKNNPSIESLFLNGPEFDGKAVQLQAGTAVNLRYLSIYDAEMTREASMELAAIESLTTLDLTGCALSESAVAEVLRSKSIETLILDACEPIGATRGIAFAELSPECPLRNLSIDRWQFEDAEWGYFPQLPQLVALRMGQIGDGVEFSEKLKKLTGLRELRVRFADSETNVHSEFCGALSQLNALEILELSEPQLTAGCFAPIAELPNLSSLFISRYSGLPPQVEPGVIDLIGEMRSLRTLSLHGDWVDRGTIKRIAALKGLENLELKSGELDEATLDQFLSQQSLRNISLEWFDLTQKTVDLLSTMSTLRQIRLSHSGISDTQLDELQKSLPQCNILR